MLIDIINHNAEHRLLSLAGRDNAQNVSLGALHFQCSKLVHTPSEEDVLLTVRPVLEDRKPAAIYFFRDGDMVITWSGAHKATLEALCSRLYERYASGVDKKLHQYYDLQVHGEDLRLLCKHKIDNDLPKGSLILADTLPAKKEAQPVSLPPPTPKQMGSFLNALKNRVQRKGLEILVVEDQVFSQKLLLSLLDRLCRAYVADDAEMALELYYAHAPDIVFLDIEMPGVNGHELAARLHALDAEAYIVMVTANHYAADVDKARENGAKGFVVKPYSKKKILEHIETYITERKLKP